jgi:hypothetical protein
MEPCVTNLHALLYGFERHHPGSGVWCQSLLGLITGEIVGHGCLTDSLERCLALFDCCGKQRFALEC